MLDNINVSDFIDMDILYKVNYFIWYKNLFLL